MILLMSGLYIQRMLVANIETLSPDNLLPLCMKKHAITKEMISCLFYEALFNMLCYLSLLCGLLAHFVSQIPNTVIMPIETFM